MYENTRVPPPPLGVISSLADPSLTICVEMEILTKLDTVKLGWSIVFIKGFLKNFFLSLKIDFVLVSSANPDEMPHYGLIRVFTVCRSTHLGVSNLQTRILLLKAIFAMLKILV